MRRRGDGANGALQKGTVSSLFITSVTHNPSTRWNQFTIALTHLSLNSCLEITEVTSPPIMFPYHYPCPKPTISFVTGDSRK